MRTMNFRHRITFLSLRHAESLQELLGRKENSDAHHPFLAEIEVPGEFGMETVSRSQQLGEGQKLLFSEADNFVVQLANQKKVLGNVFKLRFAEFRPFSQKDEAVELELFVELGRLVVHIHSREAREHVNVIASFIDPMIDRGISIHESSAMNIQIIRYFVKIC